MRSTASQSIWYCCFSCRRVNFRSMLTHLRISRSCFIDRPVFGVFGAGDYKLQPICVEDLAAVALQQANGVGNDVVNAIGQETFPYLELARTIRRALGLRRPIIRVHPELAYWSCRIIGLLVRDVVITREEIRGLMEGRLYVDAPPLGTTKLTAWIDQHRVTLGRHYTSEIARRAD